MSDDEPTFDGDAYRRRSWARTFLATLTPGVISNRAQLLTEPTPSDRCAVFEEGTPGEGTCLTDGHYLCEWCTQMAPSERDRRLSHAETLSADGAPCFSLE